MIVASLVEAMHSVDRHLRMCESFFKATVSKSQSRWLLITASCVYMSTLNSMNLILPQHSVSASTGWGCRGQRTVAAGGDDGDGGPGTTNNIERYGKLQKSSMVLWLMSRVLPSGSGQIPDSGGFQNKLFLPWNYLISTCVPRNPK